MISSVYGKFFSKAVSTVVVSFRRGKSTSLTVQKSSKIIRSENPHNPPPSTPVLAQIFGEASTHPLLWKYLNVRLSKSRVFPTYLCGSCPRVKHVWRIRYTTQTVCITGRGGGGIGVGGETKRKFVLSEIPVRISKTTSKLVFSYFLRVSWPSPLCYLGRVPAAPGIDEKLIENYFPFLDKGTRCS